MFVRNEIHTESKKSTQFLRALYIIPRAKCEKYTVMLVIQLFKHGVSPAKELRSTKSLLFAILLPTQMSSFDSSLHQKSGHYYIRKLGNWSFKFEGQLAYYTLYQLCRVSLWYFFFFLRNCSLAQK